MQNLISCLQGDLSQQEKRAVFLTVHDLGCNRKFPIFFLLYQHISAAPRNHQLYLPFSQIHHSKNLSVAHA